MNPKHAAVVILISGRGSNLQAVIDQVRAGALPIELSAVISNHPRAQGLKRAREAGIPTHVVDDREFKTNAEFEHALMQCIDACRPRLVALAGFMRVLSNDFVDHYAGRLINIHPSLLPRFRGLNTHERVLQNGATQHGASVHFVTREVDAGPVIVQAAVPVHPDDTPETLAMRVLKEEHRIYPLAIRWFAEGRLTVRDGQVRLDGKQRPEQGLLILPEGGEA
ncbi:MAG: phosphoribosylglycinamide formyltransferase [Gammaproteobacteria bacterium]|nr:MAG: phosphoribosylglycinamide formyltransferase [Gammaproteobacteria bacterium]